MASRSQPPLGDQKAALDQQSPVQGSSSAFVSTSSQPKRQNSIVSVAPSTDSSAGGSSVKRKSSIFKNPFRRNSTQDAGPSSSSSQQQQRPLSTVYANQPQSFAPPPGAPPTAALQQLNSQSVIDRSINKTGEFHLSEEQVLHILEYTVQDQGIGAFYDRRSLQRIAGEVSRSSALNSLAVSWGLPREIAADLVKLALFDCVILVDDSGSMACVLCRGSHLRASALG